jgi:hypothetical protein
VTAGDFLTVAGRFRRLFARCALSALLIAAVCNSGKAQQPQTQGDYGTRIGAFLVKGEDIDLDLDVEHRSSLMRVAPYATYKLDSSPPESMKVFVGSGASIRDMVRPASYDPDTDYAA